MNAAKTSFLFVLSFTVLRSVAQTAYDREAAAIVAKLEKSPGFSKAYKKNILGLQTDQRENPSLVRSLIEQLRKKQEIFFYRALRTRLEWRLLVDMKRKGLDSLRLFVHDRSDSALYYFTAACYYADSSLEQMARKFGFVRVGKDGLEYVDWTKMNDLRIRGWEIENADIFVTPEYRAETKDPNKRIKRIIDTAAYLYAKAIAEDNTQSYYVENYLAFITKVMALYQDEKKFQVVILAGYHGYSKKQRNKLRWPLIGSYLREKIKAGKIEPGMDIYRSRFRNRNDCVKIAKLYNLLPDLQRLKKEYR